MPVRWESLVVSLFHRVGEVAVPDPSAVDQGGYLGAAAAVHFPVRGVPADADVFPLQREFQHVLGGFPVVEGQDGLGEPVAPGSLQGGVGVRGEEESYARPGHGVAGHGLLDMVQLGVPGAEEFSPDRGVAEQVRDLEGGAHGASVGLRGFLHPAVLQPYPGSRRCIGRPGVAFDDGYGGDAWQGLSAESQGGDGLEVLGFQQFAGGVALEGQG